MTPKQLTLLISLGTVLVVSAAGVLSYRQLYTPAPGVVQGQLADAGFGLCPVRHGRARLVNPQGNVITREFDGRVCSGDIVFCWHRNADGSCDRVPAGWSVIYVRDLSAAGGGETDPVDVASECACQTDAGTCLATAPDAGTNRLLPPDTIAGPDYSWTSPTGAGCQAMSCVETSARAEWPFQCPRR